MIDKLKKKKKVPLDQDMTALAKIWATKFAYRLMKFTSNLVIKLQLTIDQLQ
jgi:hypothetical protein